MDNKIKKNLNSKQIFKKCISIILIILIFIVYCIIFNFDNVAYSQQKKLLDKIVVAIDHNYPPYIFRGEDGILKGYLVDLWKEWENVTKTNVILYAVEWSEALNAIKNGKADVIDTIFYTEERAKIFTYSKPFAQINVPIFYNNTISGIVDYDSLKGFLIAAKEGDAAVDYLIKNQITNIILFKDYKDIIIAAKEDKIKVFTVDEPCAIYYLNKYNIADQYKKGFILYKGEFHRAVRKGNEPILEYIENGFSLIPKSIYHNLNNKWFGQSLRKNIPTKTIIFISLLIVIIIVFFSLNSILLSRLVKKRTFELQIANEELEKEKTFLESLFNIFPDIIITYDKSFNEINSFIPSYFEDFKDVLKVEFLKRFKDDVKDDSIFVDNKYFNTQYDININNEYIYFDIRIIFFKNTFYLFLAQDISEKKAIEKRVIDKQKFEVIGTLASGLAHDINNILHSTLSISSLIKMMLQDNEISKESLNEYAEILEKSALRGSSIISSLHNFSKDNINQKTIFNLKNIIENSIQIFEIKYKKKITVNFNTDLNQAYFEGDENEIIQAILNLLINSYEAIEKKPDNENGQINVTLKKMDNYYHIIIEDNGIGINPEIKDKIFDPFFTTKGQGKGVGVGLTIVKKIVNNHHGEIKFSSNNNKTEFSIIIPCNYGAKEIKETEKPENEAIDLNYKKILIIDDDPNVLMVTQRSLQKKGFIVLAYDDVDDAIDSFINHKEDIFVCIIDLVMPKMNGIELLKYFESQGYKGKKVICTGYKSDERITDCKDINIDAIIEKPYQLNQLYETIKNLM